MKIKEKILILGTVWHEAGLRRLREEVDDVVEVPTLEMPRLLDEVADASVLFVRPIGERSVIRASTRALIEAGPRLKALATSTHSNDFLDMRAAAARNLPHLYTEAGYDHNVAEHMIALMLCAAKRIQYLADEFKAGRFRYSMRDDVAGVELNGKTVGIVGLGQIGSCLAMKCKLGFNMRVVAYDPYADAGVARVLGIEQVDDLGLLLEQSDFVNLCAVNTSETNHMIGAAELRRMKPSAYLINVTPALVDEGALVAALQQGVIAGAGLDVFDPDPPVPDSPILKLRNVEVTPHVGGYTRENVIRVSLNVAEMLIGFLRGKAAGHVHGLPPPRRAR